MDFQINQLADQSVIILVQKQLLRTEASDYQNKILDLIETGNKTIWVDLYKVNFILSWGIGILIHAQTTCSNRDIGFYLIEVLPKIKGNLKHLKLEKVFLIKGRD